MQFKRLKSCRISSSQPPEISFELTSVRVVGESRALRVVWSPSIMEDLRNALTMDIENELCMKAMPFDPWEEDVHVVFRPLRKMRLTIPNTIDRAVSEAMEDWVKICEASRSEPPPMTVVYRAPQVAEYIEINMTITPTGVHL